MRTIKKLNEQNQLKYILFLYFVLIYFLLATFQLIGESKDFYNYQNIFTFVHVKQRYNTEPLFMFIRKINDYCFNSNIKTIYLFTTLFSFILKWSAFKNITGKKSYFLFFLHTLAFYWILEYTQIRASCAIAIFLSSIKNLEKNESKTFVIKAFIATLFHYSAFTMFIFFIYVKLFNKKKCIYIILPVIGFFFSVLCNSSLGTRLRELFYLLQNIIHINKSGMESDFISTFNLKYSVLMIYFLINAYFTKKSDKINYILLKSMSFGLCFFYYFLPMMLPSVAVRFAEFYTSVFVLYFFMNMRNIPIKEKKVLSIIPFTISIMYSIASIRTGLL